MLTEDEKKELEGRIQYIRSLANNSVVQGRIDQNLNRIRLLTMQACLVGNRPCSDQLEWAMEFMNKMEGNSDDS